MQQDTTPRRRTDQWPFSPVTEPSTEPSTDPETQRGDHHAAPPARADSDELVARLRARRSTAGVAAAYAAAHGHPADPRTERGAARWGLTGTTAVIAVVAVLLLGLAVALFSTGGTTVTELAQLGGTEPVGTRVSAPAEDDDPAQPSGDAEPVPSGSPSPGAPSDRVGLLVHVVGEVAEPGLVTVPEGARVADAVQAAGGATGRADLTALNLARAVVDGEQLYVPEPGETVPDQATGPAGAQGPSASGQGPGAEASGGGVDINSADAAALEALPGVGPSIAQAIVEWREANGPFANVDELQDVPGIGPATLDEMRSVAQVGP